MSTRTWITGTLIALLTASAVTGFILTRDLDAEAQAHKAQVAAARAVKPGAPAPQPPRTIDQKPLITARRMAALALSPEEQALARQAERLANHEVDLAFAEAMRQAIENPPVLTPAAKEIQKVRDAAEAAVEADQILVTRLTRQLKTAPEKEQDDLEAQLEVAQAQLELHKDELEEASEDLERAGGDPQARIRRLKAAHSEGDRLSRTQDAPAPDKAFHPGSVIAKARHWLSMRRKTADLVQAQQDTEAKIARLSTRKDTFATQVKATLDARQEAKDRARGITTGKGGASRAAAKEAAADLKRFASDQRRLSSYARRIQDQRELGEVYGQWIGIAQSQTRHGLHEFLKGLLVLCSIALAAFVLVQLAHRMDRHAVADAEGKSSFGTVLRFCIRMVATLAILFVIVGLPSQTTTILGLAGAGLTVALKDFIVAFFGWFILMGRNGIRVGDWVEIKGVGGEVVEVGVLRTVLLETGSWSDAGHPTGRRVAFVNSFAMEGHFFNFTTSGQWMWDELKVLVPPGDDPYPIIAGVQRLVSEKTDASAREAEGEWQKATTRYRVQAFSATPGIQMVPTSQGIELHVRYITRAYHRHDARKGLYEDIVAMMHKKA